MVNPIKKSEVATMKKEIIPEVVIKVVNRLIAQNCRDGRAIVYQYEIIDAIKQEIVISSEAIIESGWLDFEPIYEAAGWQVEYDKPGYNENYKAFFLFK